MAVEWYVKAANQGHTWAQNNLGNCYEKGLGVAKDITKALYWFAEAAQQGDKRAKKRLDVLTHKHLEDMKLLNEPEAEEFNVSFSSNESVPF